MQLLLSGEGMCKNVNTPKTLAGSGGTQFLLSILLEAQPLQDPFGCPYKGTTTMNISHSAFACKQGSGFFYKRFTPAIRLLSQGIAKILGDEQ